jgi:hypothetical protein
MNHLLTGTAFAAALVIAAPVWAQTTPYGTQPAPYAQPAPPRPAPYAQPAPPQPAPYAQPAPYKERHAYRKHHKRYVGHTRRYYARGSSAPNDNVANQLNRQELSNLSGSNTPSAGYAPQGYPPPQGYAPQGYPPQGQPPRY